jgi:hypothetical protein
MGVLLVRLLVLHEGQDLSKGRSIYDMRGVQEGGSVATEAGDNGENDEPSRDP